MFFRSFAHLMLWALSLVLFGLALLLIAWTGLLGPSIEEQLQVAIEWTAKFYSKHEYAITRGGAIVGGVVTAVTAMLGMFKAWYYAEINLPRRLKRFIETIGEKKIVDDRAKVLATVNSLRPSTNTSQTGLLGSWRRDSKRKQLEKFVKEVRAQSDELEGTLRLLVAAKGAWEKQKATIHLANGHRASQLAQDLGSDAHATRAIQLHRREAFAEFQTAAKLDRSDSSVFELAAIEAEKLHNFDSAFVSWAEFTSLAEDRHDRIQQAKGLYHQARCCEVQSRTRGLSRKMSTKFLSDARAIIDEARHIMAERSGGRHELYAAACELSGLVRVGLGRIPTARKALVAALETYATLDPPSQPDVDRVKSLLADLDAKERAQRSDTESARAVARNPVQDVVAALEALGRARMTQGEFARAESAASEALELSRSIEPPDVETVIRLQTLMVELRDALKS